MSTLNKRWKGWIGVAVMLAVPLLVLAAIPFLGYGWQRLNGNSIVFAGWKIPIPSGYYVTQDERSRTFWRLSLGMPIRKGPFGQITIHQGKKSLLPQQFYRDLEAAIVTVAQTEGYALVARKEVQVADTRVKCFEFARSRKQPEFAVRCAMENDLLWPWFSGAKEYAPDFYAMLEGMTREQALP